MASMTKYAQIYEEIAEKINKGILSPGEKLPSKRDMALSYDVSLNTIMNAYGLLLEEGYIRSVEKKGYFVESQILVNKKPEMKKEITKRNEECLYDFTTQRIRTFPETSWKKILRYEIAEDSYYNKTDALGDLRLRSAIAAHLTKNRRMDVNAENILIGSGMEMLERILPLLDCTSVTLENPGYAKLSAIAENAGLKVFYQPLDEMGLTLPSYKTVLYSTPFNQFPTGIKMPITRKKEIVDFLERTQSYLIEDDFDAEFRITGSPSPSVYSLCSSRTIFFSTFTETIYPGLRIAYAILPDEILECYKKAYKDYSQSVPSLEQKALGRFIEEGFYESHINKTRREYIRKRNEILEILKGNEKLKADEKRNYLSLLVQVNTENTDSEIRGKLKENRIKMNLLSDMDHNGRDSKTLILGYTAMDMKKIKEGLLLLLKIL